MTDTGRPIGWEASELYDILKNRKYFFLIFWEDDKGAYFKGCQLWGMPDWDFEVVKDAWTRTKHIIREGVKFTVCEAENGSISVENNLPGISDNGIIHIRPHARKSYYELRDGSRYGSGTLSDTDILPNGERMPRQSFWLNRAYIESQLRPELVKQY